MSDKKTYRYADVAVNVPLRQTFTYIIPHELEAVLQVGMRVSVSFGRRNTYGIVVNIVDHCDYPRLKPLNSIVDEKPVINQEMLELTRWMADYYFCSWGEALFAALPSGSKNKAVGKHIFVCQLAISKSDIEDLFTTKKVTQKQLSVLKQIAKFDNELTTRHVSKLCGVTSGVLTALIKKGYVVRVKKQVELDPFRHVRPKRSQPLTLNDEQQVAVDTIIDHINSKQFHVDVVHGVTGSGKTEIYLQSIHHVIQQGKQAIVLVPEISLTPQTTARFRARFDRVEVIHSGLTPAQRNHIWQAALQGKIEVVIGPRSALFAPLPNLGLIVIDEEHDASFKQQSTPRYHARDTAIMRAKLHSIPILLGSATPSLEVYHLACHGKYNLISLHNRIHSLPLPKAYPIHMGEEFKEQRRPVSISRILHRHITDTLLDKGQLILFLNRRGFSTMVKCRMCGHELECDRCAIKMVHHRDTNEMMCHYCNQRIPVPYECPACGFVGMKHEGLGTERVENIIRKLFPESTVARMDSDTMGSRDAYERVLSDFSDKKIDILIGTQMITKGHDFANVTLVGIISADTQLHFPDFRSAERTFQLITQVAGRTGRGDKGGRVIVQTFQPDNYAIKLACAHDYLNFSEKELAIRKTYGYPPFGRLARIMGECVDEAVLGAWSHKLFNILQALAPKYNIQVLGPAPCPIEMIRKKKRIHFILKAGKSSELHECLNSIEKELGNKNKLHISVDIDPQDMM